MNAPVEVGSNLGHGYDESPSELTFDWIMTPIAALADAFFALLRIPAPDTPPRPARPRP